MRKSNDKLLRNKYGVLRNKKTERQKATDALDKYFSLFIRARDGNICFTCGASKVVMEAHRCVPQAGHLFSRSNLSTRWDELNTHCQCSGCNYLHERKPEIYTKKFLDKYGLDSYNRLYYKHNQVGKFTTGELWFLAEQYKEKYNAIQEQKEGPSSIKEVRLEKKAKREDSDMEDGFTEKTK